MARQSDHATRTISAVMLITLLGKALGLFRDRLMAVHYGTTGMEAMAFYTASRIPRVFFDVVFSSAIAACFIPVFSQTMTQKGRQAAFRFGGNFLSVMGLLTAVLTLLGILLAEPLVALFADGYDDQTAALAASLTRVMFPTVLLTGVAFSFVGILQAMDRFHVPALISVVSNLVIIGYFYLLDEDYGVYGLAVAYLVGWLLQALVQVPSLHRTGFRYHPDFSLRSEGIRQAFALMGPVMVSTWVQPINLTINSRFGSHLYGGAGVSAMEYATNLYLVIAGVFILSITNVIFPKLSRLTAQRRQQDFQDTLRQTVHSSLFFVLPMAAGLMLLARPLVSFLYGGGAFDAFSVDITSQALVWVSLGMVGYALQNILSRAYFARQEGRAPLVAGGVSILANLVLCMFLTQPLGVAGLAISSTVSSTLYALLLLIPLQVRGEGVVNRGLALDFGKMLLCAAGMAGVVWLARRGLAGLLPADKLGEALLLAACAGAGAVAYFLLAGLLRLDEMKLVWRKLARRTGKED
ncbi:MAG TPA: murein biosynthesis integral membrane protein MurJ [Candidatus Enterenecus merdae]|nr:murein biosynthesis integral membrane protein MurJ [Candidatus Enterenecus merdae]